MAQQGRVQPRELRADIRLQPAPMQSDTFAPPPRAVRNDNLARLSDALGSFSNSLGNLVPVVAAQGQKKDEEELWSLQKRLSGMTRDEQVTAVQDGTMMPWQNDFEKKAIQASHGMAFGSHRVAQIQQHLQTEFNWDNENPDDYITALINEDMTQFGDDKNFGAQYLRAMEGARTWAIEYGEKRHTGQHVKDKANAAFMVFDTKIDELIGKGADAYDVAKYAQTLYSDLGADGTLGVDYDHLDQELLNKARRLAGTHPEVALELMDMTRKGRGGQDISIATRGDMRDAYLQVQGTANKAISAREEGEYRTQIAATDLQLLEEGNLDYVEDQRYTTRLGEEKVITANDRKERAKDQFFRQSQGVATVNREEPQETLARELHVLRLSGEKHPAIERQLTGIADMAHIDLLGDPDGKKKMLGKLGTYDMLRNQSTNALLAYTKEEDRDFAEAYFMAGQYLTQEDGRPYSDDDALSFAIRSTSSGPNMPLASSQKDAIEAQVKTLGSEPGWLWGTNDVDPQNSSVAQQRVTNLAQRFVQLGVEPERAVKMAGEAVKKTSVTYNGVLLDLQGRDIPDNFKEVVDSSISRFVVDQPDVLRRNNVEPGDITIAPRSSAAQSNGAFILVDKNTMLPLVDDRGRHSVVRLEDVRAEGNRRKQDAEQQTLRDAALRSGMKSRGYEEATDLDGETYLIDRKTKEIMDYGFDERGAVQWKKTGKRLKNTAPIRGPANFLTEAGRRVREHSDEVRSDVRRLIPQIRLGNDTLIEGWRVGDEPSR